jgi:hypothetical protein
MVDFIKLLDSAGQTLTVKAKDSSAWFADSVKNINKDVKTDPNKVFTKNAQPQIGRMYLFVYDAKHKETLPFFDIYPLVFPIEFYHDGFLGINLHYLPPGARAALLNALMTISNNDKYDDSTKLSISYDLLRASSRKFSGFQNCVKRYLFGHVRSSFQYVHPSDWSKAVTLPLQKWSVNTNKRYAGSPPY